MSYRRTLPIAVVVTLLSVVGSTGVFLPTAAPATRAGSGAQEPERVDKLAAFVRKTMAETAVPGVAVGILDKGAVYTAAFGVTSVENPLEVTSETLFQIGSITKTMTGTAIMRLVEAGKLDLDAPVRSYLPDFMLGDEAAAAEATVRHLLTHMGGWVGDYFDTTGEGDDALSRMMERMADLEQLAPIGTVWSYNNSGFYVAGRIIEVVTGHRYEDAMQELVLEPLGLDRTFLRPSDVMTRRFAVGHTVSDTGIRVAEPWPLYRAAYPAGGAITTVIQLLKYAEFHLGDGMSATGERVLTPESLAVMQAEHAVKIGTDDRMGLTWHLSDVGSERTLGHGGGTNGQVSVLSLLPDRDFAFVILTNANRGGEVTREVGRWILDEYFGLAATDPVARETTDAELMEYAGQYRRPMSDLEVQVESGHLMIRQTPKQGFPTRESPVPPPGPFRAFGVYADDRIVQIDGWAQGEFVRKADGAVGWLRMGGRIHVKQ